MRITLPPYCNSSTGTWQQQVSPSVLHCKPELPLAHTVQSHLNPAWLAAHPSTLPSWHMW